MQENSLKIPSVQAAAYYLAKQNNKKLLFAVNEETELEEFSCAFETFSSKKVLLINEDKNTQAIVRMENDNVIGFIMFQPIVFESWFFEEKCGFIREFWIANDYRNIGHGSNLINQVESYFKKQEIFRTILTTDTAKDFYFKHGYHLQKSAKAKNGDDVYTKMLIF